MLELVQNAGRLFHSASVEQKRKILKLLYWNLELTDGKLGYALRKPFYLFLNPDKTDNWLGLIDTIRTDCYHDVIALVPQMPSVQTGLLMTA